MQKFEIGQTYEVESHGNSDIVYKFTIVSRTNKTVTVKSQTEKAPRRCKIKVCPTRGESCSPFGRDGEKLSAWIIGRNS